MTATAKRMNLVLTRTLVYALLLLFAFVTVFPFLWMLLTTFKSSKAVFAIPPTWVPDMLFRPGMWENYITVFTKHNFLRYTFNSVFVSFMAAAGQVITCSLAGFAFARMRFRGRELLFGALLATSMVPVEVSIIPEFLLMIKLDWLNTYLPLIVPSFLTGAYGTFMLREFFANIPQDLEDAAAMDGASPFRIYYSVFIPLAGSALVTLFVLAFINNWNELLRPVFYISESHLRTLPLGLMAFKGAYESRWNLLLTGSVISIVPLLILYIAAQRFIVEGIATTGLK
jgi:multiple sugar transport system permease protein